MLNKTDAYRRTVVTGRQRIPDTVIPHRLIHNSLVANYYFLTSV